MIVGRSWTSRSERETREIGRRIAEELRPDGTLLLEGDLGAGKTVLVRGVAEALGIDGSEVRSPTFILAREHRNDQGVLELLHLDLYRLSPDEVEAAGLDEMMCDRGVKAVEWAERLRYRPAGALTLRLRTRGDNSREILEVYESGETHGAG